MLVQLLTMWLVRGYIWVSQALSAMMVFHGRGDLPFLCLGLVGFVLMTLFNLLMVIDSTKAAVKWLPKQWHKQNHATKLACQERLGQSAFFLRNPPLTYSHHFLKQQPLPCKTKLDVKERAEGQAACGGLQGSAGGEGGSGYPMRSDRQLFECTRGACTTQAPDALFANLLLWCLRSTGADSSICCRF